MALLQSSGSIREGCWSSLLSCFPHPMNGLPQMLLHSDTPLMCGAQSNVFPQPRFCYATALFRVGVSLCEESWCIVPSSGTIWCSRLLLGYKPPLQSYGLLLCMSSIVGQDIIMRCIPILAITYVCGCLTQVYNLHLAITLGLTQI